MKKINYIVLLLLLLIYVPHTFAKGHKDNYTIIVSLDGFRWDYPIIHHTPHLDKMGKEGVSGVVRPSYPSLTFPNHYTLITGLVPDHHGIINNVFFDKEQGIKYAMSDSLTRYNPKYYGGEPIWTTAQRQGVKAASIYWVGSDIPIKDSYPTYYKEWGDRPRLNFAQRVDTALAWIKKPESERPRLITLYLDEPDGSGHHFGPKGNETEKTLHVIDSLMGILIDGVKGLPFADKVNLIITSDHGMAEISKERFIQINDYLKPEWCDQVVGSNPTAIFAKAGKQDSIYNALKDVEHIKVYRKNEFPKSLNYGTNKNIGDISVVPDLGWQFGYQPSSAMGAHGFDPQNTDMQVIFFAFGPDFKEKYKGKVFDNTAIYPLLAYLLGIQPAKNDGDLKQVKQFLK